MKKCNECLSRWQKNTREPTPVPTHPTNTPNTAPNTAPNTTIILTDYGRQAACNAGDGFYTENADGFIKGVCYGLGAVAVVKLINKIFF